jgi:predicted metal-dependent peptidase
MVYRPCYFSLNKVTDNPAIDTAAVDGRTMFFCVPWMLKWSVDEQMGVIAHECLHVMLRHHLRWPGLWKRARAMYGKLDEGRTFRVWNWSCDIRINPDLIRDGWKLPKDGVFDPEGKYAGWSAERIFFAKMDEMQKQEKETGKPAEGPPAPSWGGFNPFPGKDGDGKPSEEELRDEEQKISRQVAAGIAMAKARGISPGSVKELVQQETVRHPDWKDLLPAEIQKVVGADQYTTARVSRSGRRLGVILPGTVSYRLGKTVIAFDTSGSISGKLLALWGGQANGLIQSECPEQVIVLQCDAKVQSEQRLEEGEELGPMVMKGRGGTKFEPVFKWVEENDPDVELIIYMTDLEGSFPKEPPPCPVIWLSTKDHVAPFGTTIRIHP